MMQTREIYCCGCQSRVQARLTHGGEIYPHREDLASLPFWKCDVCRNHVGCHHQTKDPTRPLGCIPTKEIKNARQHIHRILDPLWKSAPNKRKARNEIYEKIAAHLDRSSYHTANIRSIEEARKVWLFVNSLRK